MNPHAQPRRSPTLSSHVFLIVWDVTKEAERRWTATKQSFRYHITVAVETNPVFNTPNSIPPLYALPYRSGRTYEYCQDFTVGEKKEGFMVNSIEQYNIYIYIYIICDELLPVLSKTGPSRIGCGSWVVYERSSGHCSHSYWQRFFGVSNVCQYQAICHHTHVIPGTTGGIKKNYYYECISSRSG